MISNKTNVMLDLIRVMEDDVDLNNVKEKSTTDKLRDISSEVVKQEAIHHKAVTDYMQKVDEANVAFKNMGSNSMAMISLFALAGVCMIAGAVAAFTGVGIPATIGLEIAGGLLMGAAQGAANKDAEAAEIYQESGGITELYNGFVEKSSTEIAKSNAKTAALQDTVLTPEVKQESANSDLIYKFIRCFA